MTIREIFRELTRSEKWEMLHRLMIDFQADYGNPPKDPKPKPKEPLDKAYKCGVCGATFDILRAYEIHCLGCKWSPLGMGGGKDTI